MRSRMAHCDRCKQANFKSLMERDDLGDLICPDCWPDVNNNMSVFHRIELWFEKLPRPMLSAMTAGIIIGTWLLAMSIIVELLK